MKKKTLSAASLSGLAALMLGITACSNPATGQSSADDYGMTISDEVLSVYASGRLRKPEADLTDDDKSGVRGELQDLYLLAHLAKNQNLDEKDAVKAQMALQKRSILAQALLADYVEKNPATEDELLAEYARVTESTAGEQYKARHILLETEDAARDVIKTLDGGADFAELAKEKSTGPSGPQGGDLGWFSPESMVKPFSDAVMAMEDGAHSKEPVQTQFGFHVILREESKANTPPPFEGVKEQLRPAAEQKKFQDYLKKQRELAGLEPAES